MSNFVTLTKEQFEGSLPSNFNIVEGTGAKEIIYDLDTKNQDINVRIYSTVDIRTNQTRDIGKDAIRVVFWDKVNDRPVGKGKKILRVEGATTIEDRIKQRIAEFMDTVYDQEVVNFEYVRAVLEANSWSDFAVSLLENLDEFGSLSDGQLAYIVGNKECTEKYGPGKNPRGKQTFERMTKNKNPDFFSDYMERRDDENEIEQETGLSDKTGKEVDDKRKEEEKQETGNEGVLDGSNGKAEGEVEHELIGDAKPISTKKYKPYKYSFKSFNPVQSAVLPYRDDNVNEVIGANTSAGKTICAEFVMDSILEQGKVILYASPLKALTQEKYDDWSKRFPNKNITILTGDYVLSEKRKKELTESDIVVLTSEMLDSRTRRMESEKNFWLMNAGLLIIDESHILATERGHAVETGIMRFTKLNPDARVIFLSATMPNVGELGEWLTSLNGKDTKVFFSTWRPVILNIHYEEYQIQRNRRGYEDYWANQKAKMDMAVEIMTSKPDEKFLVFVHDKGTGRRIVNRLRGSSHYSLGINAPSKGPITVNNVKIDEGTGISLEPTAEFHNADLDLLERLEVEQKFQDRENGIRVLVSTSTLAWGRNLPARNVIIVGVHRGINDVDQLDIIQMAGRAGRYGIDDQGDVYLIIPEGSSQAWEKTFRNPRPVNSVLNNHHTLAFHVLAEIHSKDIKSVHELMKWYQRSLAYRQGIFPFSNHDAESLMEDLIRMEMVGMSGINPFVTGLGKVSAWLYFSPYDVFAWFCNFGSLLPDNLTDETIAWAIGDIPSNDLGYVPKDLKEECDEWRWRLRNRGIIASDALPSVIGVYNCLAGVDMKEETGLLKAIRRSIIFDISRQVQALSLMDEMYAKWGKSGIWEVLPTRIKYGISEELVELTKLPGIGGKRASMMWKKGIKSIEDVAAKDNVRKLKMVFRPHIATQLRKDAQKLLKERRM